MATLEQLQQQATNAQRRLNDARKRADERLGKRLRELVTGDERLSREVQDERANAWLDERFAEQGDEDEQSEYEHGQRYSGSEYHEAV